MTKREIFEQLLSAYAIAKNNAEAFASRTNDEIRDILRDIILDLAVPEKDTKPDAPEVPYKGVEKIVDPTGKNPTSYKCPFCNSYTITKTFRDIAGYLDGTCDHCGRTFTLTEEGKIL